MSSVTSNPFLTFVLGILLAIILIGLILTSCNSPNNTKEFVTKYRAALTQAGAETPTDEDAALQNFTEFLKNVGTKSYIEEHTEKVYAPGAYLNDTLATHSGPEEIKKYFLQTADTMTSFELAINDTIRSGSDYYIKWTMVFAAPKLSGGKPIHSVGISQVRFTKNGKVAFHQDFWDSGQNIYGQIPVIGGMIGIVQKRLE